jgi:hypothetical protein
MTNRPSGISTLPREWRTWRAGTTRGDEPENRGSSYGHDASPDRLTRRVARRAPRAARRREGAHSPPRRAEREAPLAPDGRDHEGLRLHRPRRARVPPRPVRGPRPAHRRPLHVRPRMGRRLPELLRRSRRGRRRPAAPPPHARHDARVRVTRADREDRALQADEGLDLLVVLVLRNGLQRRLRRHDRSGRPVRHVQLPPRTGSRARRVPRHELLPARRRPRVPHVLVVRARRGVDGRLLRVPRPHRARAPGGLGGAEGARRASGRPRPTSRAEPYAAGGSGTATRRSPNAPAPRSSAVRSSE